jgi:hypothetical protein
MEGLELSREIARRVLPSSRLVFADNMMLCHVASLGAELAVAREVRLLRRLVQATPERALRFFNRLGC